MLYFFLCVRWWLSCRVGGLKGVLTSLEKVWMSVSEESILQWYSPEFYSWLIINFKKLLKYKKYFKYFESYGHTTSNNQLKVLEEGILRSTLIYWLMFRNGLITIFLKCKKIIRNIKNILIILGLTVMLDLRLLSLIPILNELGSNNPYLTQSNNKQIDNNYIF
jgi:hypothetical protein